MRFTKVKTSLFFVTDFFNKILLEMKSVRVELGEAQPCVMVYNLLLLCKFTD